MSCIRHWPAPVQNKLWILHSRQVCNNSFPGTGHVILVFANLRWNAVQSLTTFLVLLIPRSLIIIDIIQINVCKYILFYCLQQSHKHVTKENTTVMKFLLPKCTIQVQNRRQHLDAIKLNKVTDDLLHFYKFYRRWSLFESLMEVLVPKW